MDLPPNPFEAALARRERPLGLLALADGYAAEICAGIGFDRRPIDGEHAPNDVRSIPRQSRAVAPCPAHPVGPPPIGETDLIEQHLDVGVQILLAPWVEAAVQAPALVEVVRYPPRGVRGVGGALARASRFNRAPAYPSTASDAICLLVPVESAAGLAELDAIAATAGVDGVFVGPSDLSAALGQLGAPGHEDVQAPIRDAVDRVLAAGRAAGILTTDVALARTWADLGATFVAFGTDVGLLVRGGEALLRSFTADAPAPPARPRGAVH